MKDNDTIIIEKDRVGGWTLMWEYSGLHNWVPELSRISNPQARWVQADFTWFDLSSGDRDIRGTVANREKKSEARPHKPSYYS